MIRPTWFISRRIVPILPACLAEVVAEYTQIVMEREVAEYIISHPMKAPDPSVELRYAFNTIVWQHAAKVAREPNESWACGAWCLGVGWLFRPWVGLWMDECRRFKKIRQQMATARDNELADLIYQTMWISMNCYTDPDAAVDWSVFSQ